MDLTDLKTGESGAITELGIRGDSRIRICQMGLTVGTVVTIVKKAPLGDPIELGVRGYRICLRAKEAKQIGIERLPAPSGEVSYG